MQLDAGDAVRHYGTNVPTTHRNVVSALTIFSLFYTEQQPYFIRVVIYNLTFYKKKTPTPSIGPLRPEKLK